MKVIIGTTEIAGFCSRLCQGFLDNGFDATFINFGSNNYSYQNKSVSWLVSFHEQCRLLRSGHKLDFVLQRILGTIQNIIRGIVFFQSLFITQMYIFVFNATFFNLKELWLLRLLGKKICMIYLGSDTRPWWMNGAIMMEEDSIQIDNAIENMSTVKKKIALSEKYVDLIVCHALSAQFLKKPFVPFLCLGYPFQVPKNICQSNSLSDGLNGVVKILHAPSSPLCKGSVEFRTIIEELKKDGLKIEYTEIHGKPNSEVIEEIMKTDIVFDELYSDTALAGLGSEAAAYGKAVILGSYASREDYGCPDELIPPAYVCKPNEIKEAVRNLVTKPIERNILGDKLYCFVKNCWDCSLVAMRLVEWLNSPDKVKMYNPQTISYYQGWGLNNQKQKKILQNMIELKTSAILGISDKPYLESQVNGLIKNA